MVDLPGGMETIVLPPGPAPEPGRVYVGAGSATRVGQIVRDVASGATRAFVAVDANVAESHGAQVEAGLAAAGFSVHRFLRPDGEVHKTPEGVVAMVRSMVEAGLGRRDVLVAVGGGVTGDAAGFAAAVFMRGIRWAFVPTSLLAQVDASVGGKTAVDLPEGKNLMGAFHTPACVVIDPRALDTLPPRQWLCGVAEMVKHGLLFDAGHLSVLRRALAGGRRPPAEEMATLVAHQVRLKARCIGPDMCERNPAAGGRALLNLGHTVGHALETLSHHRRSHGEAVALGLRAAARVSEGLAIAPDGFEAEVVKVLADMGLPSDLDAALEPHDAGALEAAMAADKKRDGGTISYIALAGVARPRVVPLVPARIVDLLRRDGAPR